MSLVGIDCRFVSRKAGLGTYTRELVSELLRLEGNDRYVLFTHNDPLTDAWIATLPCERFTRFPVDCVHYSFAEQVEIPKAIRASGAEMYFAPHFNVPFFCPVPYVVTIHDLILHRFAGEASLIKRGLYRVLMLRSLRRARHIIAVSSFTAAEVSSVYGKRIAKKTSVVTEGVSSVFSRATPEEIAEVRSRYQLPERYLLYVGNAKEHKNIPMLLAAHRSVSEAPPLVLVTNDATERMLQPSDRVVVLKDIDDATLRVLYSGASSFVTASLYEGFCLPILEAHACGCPVIAFDVSAIPEVAGEHDLLVQPTIEALSVAFSNVPTISSKLDSRFSWKTAAKETQQILIKAFTL